MSCYFVVGGGWDERLHQGETALHDSLSKTGETELKSMSHRKIYEHLQAVIHVV